MAQAYLATDLKTGKEVAEPFYLLRPTDNPAAQIALFVYAMATEDKLLAAEINALIESLTEFTSDEMSVALSFLLSRNLTKDSKADKYAALIQNLGQLVSDRDEAVKTMLRLVANEAHEKQAIFEQELFLLKQENLRQKKLMEEIEAECKVNSDTSIERIHRLITPEQLH